jgi:hypothetical protein
MSFGVNPCLGSTLKKDSTSSAVLLCALSMIETKESVAKKVGVLELLIEFRKWSHQVVEGITIFCKKKWWAHLFNSLVESDRRTCMKYVASPCFCLSNVTRSTFER